MPCPMRCDVRWCMLTISGPLHDAMCISMCDSICDATCYASCSVTYDALCCYGRYRVLPVCDGAWLLYVKLYNMRGAMPCVMLHVLLLVMPCAMPYVLPYVYDVWLLPVLLCHMRCAMLCVMLHVLLHVMLSVMPCDMLPACCARWRMIAVRRAV